MNSGSAAEEIPKGEEAVDDIDESREVIPYVYSITAYGADYPVDSLVQRLDSGDIVVPRFSWRDEGSEITGFQREYVWPRPKSDRFIESLLLGLPVPGIFLVKEPSGRFLVLDGHQRLHTLQSFYNGDIHDKVYRLEDVETRFQKKRYEDLDVEDRRRLDDSILHATVIRQDEPTEDQSSVYMIFERLNTGGVNLQPQEIRVALYHGELVGVLRQLNELRAWRNLYGKRSRRLKDMELILRFFAFYYRAGDYKSPMKEFLNTYMASNKDLACQGKNELVQIFTDTVTLLDDVVGHDALRPLRAVNAAVADSVMTGLARRIERAPIHDASQVANRYDALLQDHDYQRAIADRTAHESNVDTRIKAATAAFANVQ